MKESIEAIYQQGVFRPLRHLEIPEGQHVRLVVEALSESVFDDMLELAARVYEGLSKEQVEEIEKIALNRDDFFGDVTEQ
jgi:predicted DNA-binding antitoxin AbrB/MazE fold protein